MYMVATASKAKVFYVIQESPDYENSWQDEPGIPPFKTYQEAQSALDHEVSHHPRHSYHFSHRILEKYLD